VREHLGWWAVTKKRFFLRNLLEITGQKKFSNCPNFLKHEDIFLECPKNLGLNETIFNICKLPVIIEQSENSQNSNKF
jgi:hypothetical protein